MDAYPLHGPKMSAIVPEGYLPVFGVVSFASFVGLLVALFSLAEKISKASSHMVIKSAEYIQDQAERAAAAIKDADARYVHKDVYSDHYARLRHLETSCDKCEPLKDTKALRRET